jgi:hypothetical protein
VTVLNSEQWRRRRQVETVIRLMAPALDTILFVGDRVSRAVGGRDELGPPVRRRELAGDRRSRIGGPPA